MPQADMHIRFIETNSQLVTFCQSAQKARFLTVDTEFMREKTYYPQLCLVQVATDNEAVVIDALAEGIDLSPLWDLLIKTQMPKIFHAASQDLEIFAHLSGSLPNPLFDTQIAAMVIGLGDQIGYDKLIKDIIGVSIDKSSRYSDWSLRPLAKRQIDYAAGDVTHLRRAYHKLMELLNEQNRQSWMREEMAKLSDIRRYQSEPMDAYKRLKVKSDKPRFLAILKQIAAWREKEAQHRNIPRGHILRDDTILDIAGTEPTTVEALSNIRGINDKMAKGRIGKSLIQAVNTGIATPKDQISIPSRKPPLTDEEAAKLSLLKMLLTVKATKVGTASRLLANANDLEFLARTPIDCWIASTNTPACLEGWRYDLFGEAAKQLVMGTLWIGFKDGNICIRKDSIQHPPQIMGDHQG